MNARIRIGLENFNGPACGFVFVNSQCEVELKEPHDHRWNRLKAVFPSSTKEEIQPQPKQVIRERKSRSR